MKRKLFLLLCTLLTMIGVLNVKADGYTDYINEANGWTQVTDNAGIATDGSAVYAIVASDFGLAVGIPDEGSASQLTYQTVSGQPARTQVWSIESDTYGSGGYALKNLGNMEKYVQAETGSWDMHANSNSKNIAKTCYQFSINDGTLYIQTNNDVKTDVGHYWGDWDVGTHANGSRLAGNKAEANRVTFKLYKKILSVPGQDYTFLIANPSFENPVLASGTATNHQLHGWTGASDAGEDFISYKTASERNFTGVDGNNLYNTWGGSPANGYFVKQTINLPAGNYRLSCIVASDQNNSITLTFGTKEITVKMSNAKTVGQKIVAGLSQAEAGNVEIKLSSNTWFKADDFRLYYLPENELTDLVIKNANCESNEYWDGGGRTLENKNDWAGRSRTVLTQNGTGYNRKQAVTFPYAGVYCLDVYGLVAAAGGEFGARIADSDAGTNIISTSTQSETDASMKYYIDANGVETTTVKGSDYAKWTIESVYFNIEANNTTKYIHLHTSNKDDNGKVGCIGGMKLVYLGVASAGNPINISDKFNNPDFKRGTSSTSTQGSGGQVVYPKGWTFSRTYSGWNDTYVDGSEFNAWAGTITLAELKQSTTKIPNGIYRISADIKSDNNATVASQVALCGGSNGTWVRSDNVTMPATADFKSYSCYVPVTNRTLQVGIRSDKNYYRIKNVKVELVDANSASTAFNTEVACGKLQQEAWGHKNDAALDFTSDDFAAAEGCEIYKPKANSIILVQNASQVTNTVNVVAGGTCANLVLSDDEGYAATTTFNATSANYTRNGIKLSKNRYATVYLPYAFSTDGLKVMACTDYENDVLTFTSVDVTEPSTPYLVRIADDGVEDEVENYTFTGSGSVSATDASGSWFKGTYASQTLYANADGYNYYGFSTKNGDFRQASASGNTCAAFRAYVKLAEEPGARAIVRIGDEITGIATLDANGTISGVEAQKDGKYIENNQIIIVKNGVKYGANGQKLN
jgi:hypothetical protein